MRQNYQSYDFQKVLCFSDYNFLDQFKDWNF